MMDVKRPSLIKAFVVACGSGFVTEILNSYQSNVNLKTYLSGIINMDCSCPPGGCADFCHHCR